MTETILGPDGVLARTLPGYEHRPAQLEMAAAVEAAWIAVYRDPDKYWDLYELAEKLVDLEFRFQQWRFAHLKTVERIIGFKGGTGGSAGAAYLAKALQGSFFPELFGVRTVL